MRELLITSILEELNVAFRVSVVVVALWARRRDERCETRAITCHGCGVKVTAQQYACHSWTTLNLADKIEMVYTDSREGCDRIHAIAKCQYDLA